jgi:hypothetical protein
MDIENRMVCERAWPVPRTLTREARIDELTRDGLFREWDWLDNDAAQAIASMAVAACFREPGTAEEALAKIKAEIESYVETWAENEAENEA